MKAFELSHCCSTANDSPVLITQRLYAGIARIGSERCQREKKQRDEAHYGITHTAA